LRLVDYGKNVVILPILLVLSVILGIFSYNYFIQTADQIQGLALDDLQTNSEIEVYSISNILENSIYFVNSNLERIVNSPSITNWNITGIQRLLDLALNSTNYVADGYYLLDSNGTLVTFTGINNQQHAPYKGINLGYRDYFQIPKQTGTLYTSTVIESNDKIPRIYVSLPITRSNNTELLDPALNSPQSRSNSISFKGIVVASIAAKTLGSFLENQLHPKFNGEIGLIDRDGTIIYSSNQTFIGKNYFGEEIQSFMKTSLNDNEERFNSIMNEALTAESGVTEFSFENSTTTIAYQAVIVPSSQGQENRVGTLFITVPHTLAGDVTILISTQNLVSFAIIFAIASISIIVAIILLSWNRILKNVVDQKTSQLRDSIENLEKVNVNLKSHDKLQKEFINIAAHELRTPTQAISGNLELIEMTYLPSMLKETSINQDKIAREFENLVGNKEMLYEFRKSLISTYRNAQRLEKLVNDILDTSRIESNRLDLHKESFSLNEKIANVINDISNKTNNYKDPNNSGNVIEIGFEPQQDPITVFADKIRIFEVPSNLLSNAIKFSDGKPITISARKIKTQKNSFHGRDPEDVNVHDIRDAEIAVVSVIDKGKGIDGEILPRLFTKFATKSTQGTGLGLYISKNIIEAHGGQIWAKNNDDGKGATFTFSLPLDQ
jgi:signal transduction histidine kinase